MKWVKNTRLAQIQNCKGNPFEKFLRLLSTNEKPAFWALDQPEAPILAWFSVLPKSRVYQSNANVPIGWQPSVTGVPMEYQWTTNGIPMEYQWTTNGMSIDWQSIANWYPIRCQLTIHRMSIDFQLNANWLPIKLSDPINYQWYVNWLPIESLRKVRTGASSYNKKASVPSVLSDSIDFQLYVNWQHPFHVFWVK